MMAATDVAEMVVATVESAAEKVRRVSGTGTLAGIALIVLAVAINIAIVQHHSPDARLATKLGGATGVALSFSLIYWLMLRVGRPLPPFRPEVEY